MFSAAWITPYINFTLVILPIIFSIYRRFSNAKDSLLQQTGSIVDQGVGMAALKFSINQSNIQQR